MIIVLNQKDKSESVISKIIGRKLDFYVNIK